MSKAKTFKPGDIFESRSHGFFKVLERTPGNALVQFVSTGYITTVSKGAVRSGIIKDRLLPTIYGVGFYGDGSFTNTLDKTTTAKALETWHTMFKRCYSEFVHTNHQPYTDCFVSEYWCNFQNFAKFYVEDPYRLAGWELDKDLLVKSNKEYGPNTCVFLPRDINGYLKTNAKRRGKYPIGVRLHSSGNLFEALCRDNSGQQINLGKFSSGEAAFEAYKTFKQNVLKEKANFWKNKIHPLAYNALMEYEVHIED